MVEDHLPAIASIYQDLRGFAYSARYKDLYRQKSSMRPEAYIALLRSQLQELIDNCPVTRP